MESPLAVSELREAMDRLLNAVQRQFGDQLSFDVDYYWNVPIPEAYQPHKKPRLDLGQVSEDAESVREFIAMPDEEVAIWHECEHLAGVLRAIAAQDMATFS